MASTGKPTIERISHPSAPRKSVHQARPGDVLRIDGKGFGERAVDVRVCFDSVEVPPFAQPFAETSLYVTAPLPQATTQGLAVRIGRVISRQVPFRVVRRRRKRAPGSDTLEFLQAFDEYAALVGATARRAASGTPFAAELGEAAANLDGCRRVMQRNAELLLQWRAVQATAVARAAPMEAVRTIERIDEAVRTAAMADGMRALTRNTFGAKSAFAVRSGVSLASWAIEGIGSALGGLDFDTTGFLLTEGAKLIEVYEQVVKVFSLSFTVGGSGGIAILNGIVLGDVGFSPGEGISAVAKLVDIVAQIFDRLAGDPAQDKLDRIEAKADRAQQDAAVLRAAIDTQFARTEGKLDRAEGKADRDTEKLDLLEAKCDRIEAKADRDTEKLDALEAKSDRIEAKADRDTEKLDILEAKADRGGQALDRLEGKADAQEGKLDRIEEKADRQENKADRAEEKLDRLETKADREESKLDRLEGKADREEAKLDRLEGKADRAEGKLDRVEAKLDFIEPKLDRLEAKADRPLPVAPHEGAVAAQRGGAINVTAVVVATRGADNRVHLRAAVDVPPQALDEEAAWSQWIDFGRPALALAIVEASVSASYADGSDTILDALLSVRDAAGRVFHRALEGKPDDRLPTPAQWTDWAVFLGQP